MGKTTNTTNSYLQIQDLEFPVALVTARIVSESCDTAVICLLDEVRKAT